MWCRVMALSLQILPCHLSKDCPVKSLVRHRRRVSTVLYEVSAQVSLSIAEAQMQHTLPERVDVVDGDAEPHEVLGGVLVSGTRCQKERAVPVVVAGVELGAEGEGMVDACLRCQMVYPWVYCFAVKSQGGARWMPWACVKSWV